MAVIDHPDNHIQEVIVSVFKKLRDAEVWKAIELLVEKVLEQGGSLKRFYIEDTLMMAGIKIQKATATSGFALDVHEEDNLKPAAEKTTTSRFETNLTPLEVMVRDFLKIVKSEWKEDELQSATIRLHEIYKKYANS